MIATATLTDEQALHAALDADPSDIATRLVLADLLEEHSRDEEAAYQRWAVEKEKWPSEWPWNPTWRRWDWWADKRDEDPHSLVGIRVYVRLRARNGSHGIYDTRREAEDDLRRVLAEIADDAQLIKDVRLSGVSV